MGTFNSNGNKWTIEGRGERNIEGIVENSETGLVQVIVTDHSDYSIDYLKRKLLKTFKEEKIEPREILFSRFTKGQIILTKELPSGTKPGDSLTLPRGTINYKTNNASPSCNGKDIKSNVKVKYIKSYPDVCYQGTENNNYNKFEVL
ncbi:MAG: hypothetical protein WBG71_12330 [Leeuwenhoekiella sp.]